MRNIENYKQRFFNLMESTIGDVKPLISEQENVRNLSIILGCADVEDESRLPGLLNGLMDSTDIFASSDWNEDGIVRAFQNCKGQSEFEQTKKILNCALPQMGIKLQDGNSLLTVARQSFTGSFLGMGTTDIGDEDNKNKVQSVFSKYGLRTRI
jgi:hypothetical protein